MASVSGKRYFPLSQRDEELDEKGLAEAACRAFNPDNMIDVRLPSGAVARVSPDISPEDLAALDRLAMAAVQTIENQQGQRKNDGRKNDGR